MPSSSGSNNILLLLLDSEGEGTAIVGKVCSNLPIDTGQQTGRPVFSNIKPHNIPFTTAIRILESEYRIYFLVQIRTRRRVPRENFTGLKLPEGEPSFHLHLVPIYTSTSAHTSTPWCLNEPKFYIYILEFRKGKSKGKGHPRTGHEGPDGE